jgi:hypothetical protein
MNSQKSLILNNGAKPVAGLFLRDEVIPPASVKLDNKRVNQKKEKENIAEKGTKVLRAKSSENLKLTNSVRAQQH